MRSALCGVLLCGIGVRAAAQEREVTFEEAPQLTVTGFAVGSAGYDRVQTAKFTGAIVRLTASPRVELAGAVANGWNVDVDNNRGKTGMLRIQWIPVDGLTIGASGVYGPEQDGTDAHQRSLLAPDVTLDLG